MNTTNLYWPIYKNLEKELLDLPYSIPFCDDQLGLGEKVAVMVSNNQSRSNVPSHKKGKKPMKLKFTHQAFQTDAVNAVCDLFTGGEKIRTTFFHYGRTRPNVPAKRVRHGERFAD